MIVGFGAFWVISATFNFLPFHLSERPISASTTLLTSLHAAYRIGSGRTPVAGSLLFAAALAVLLVPSLPVLVVALLGSCAGFFATHAAASGAPNRRLTSSRGRGNALHILFHYCGGAVGIAASVHAWRHGGWLAVLGLNAMVLTVALAVGWYEMREEKPATGTAGVRPAARPASRLPRHPAPAPGPDRA